MIGKNLIHDFGGCGEFISAMSINLDQLGRGFDLLCFSEVSQIGISQKKKEKDWLSQIYKAYCCKLI